MQQAEEEPTARGRRSLELREEELAAHKRQVQAGEVQVGRRVISEEKVLDIPLTHEEVVIEHRPGDRRPAPSLDEEPGEWLTVPVMAEEVIVEKQPVVREEVTLRKQPVTRTQCITATIHHEEPTLEWPTR